VSCYLRNEAQGELRLVLESHIDVQGVLLNTVADPIDYFSVDLRIFLSQLFVPGRDSLFQAFVLASRYGFYFRIADPNHFDFVSHHALLFSPQSGVFVIQTAEAAPSALAG
jgi:hypothetical protein